jgi:hypothetical protein
MSEQPIQDVTDGKKASDKSNVVDTFDQFGKSVGLVLGGLYVLGLVISNVALQRLGLSDFAILQPRCIATGALFALYMIIAMLLITPIVGLFATPLVFALRSKSLKQRFGLFFALVAVCVVVELNFVFIASLFYGGLTPWSVWPTLGGPRVYLSELIQLAWSSFGHAWAAIAGWLGAMFVAVELSLLYARKFHYEEILEGRALFEFPMAGMAAIFVLIYAVPGFARDVYPNLGQGVGGGQPIVARLQISGTLPLIEDGKIFRRVTETTSAKEPKSFVFTEPLVIWYQSASFVYVTPIAINDRRQRPIALDAKSVQVIQQVAQAVEVLDSSRIIAVHDLP